MRNTIIVTGNLGSDPEFIQSEGKKGMARFSLAANKAAATEKNKTSYTSHTNWFPVRAFDNLAIKVKESLRKGDLITLQGELRTYSVKEKNGTTRHGFEIVAHDIQRATLLPKPMGDKAKLCNIDLPEFADFDSNISN